MPRLHWIQASVFAGELTKTAADDLFQNLESVAKAARVMYWVFDRPPQTKFIGAQEDQESFFL
jgi:CRISPR/Cas system-associated endoribonuclease Cas2